MRMHNMPALRDGAAVFALVRTTVRGTVVWG